MFGNHWFRGTPWGQKSYSREQWAEILFSFALQTHRHRLATAEWWLGKFVWSAPWKLANGDSEQKYPPVEWLKNTPGWNERRRQVWGQRGASNYLHAVFNLYSQCKIFSVILNRCLSLTSAQSRLTPPVSWMQSLWWLLASVCELPVRLRLFLSWGCVTSSHPTPNWWSNSSKSEQRKRCIMELCSINNGVYMIKMQTQNR